MTDLVFKWPYKLPTIDEKKCMQEIGGELVGVRRCGKCIQCIIGLNLIEHGKFEWPELQGLLLHPICLGVCLELACIKLCKLRFETLC